VKESARGERGAHVRRLVKRVAGADRPKEARIEVRSFPKWQDEVRDRALAGTGADQEGLQLALDGAGQDTLLWAVALEFTPRGEFELKGVGLRRLVRLA
jgi:hypothetical protein